jgi:ubiquinone/menaquinone biosynthesis C-methylase UbiE
MKKSPREFYTEQGAEWLSQRKTDEQTSKELEYITRFLKKGWKVLDLACGYGRMAFPLASMGFEVEGIDITPAFIEKAKEKAEKLNLKIGFRVGDIKALPYEDNSFDSAICMWNAFSELVEENEQISSLKEIHRVLREGGLAFIEVRNHRSSKLVDANAIDGIEAMPSYNHTRGSMRKLMKLSGISSYRVYIDDFGGRKRLLLEIGKP